MRTEGTIELKLFTDTYKTTHIFYVLGENSEKQYDAILGKDFFEVREGVINYCTRQIIMDEVVVQFDPKPSANKTEPYRLTLKARTENIVTIPTTSKGLDKSECALTLTFTAVAGTDNRLSCLRDWLRLGHLNNEERASIVAICEEYDIFHLSDDKLT
jgi:hypothetical protein